MTLHFCARSRATVPGDEHACACTRAAPAAASLVPSATAPAVGGGGGAVSRTGGPTNRITAATGRSARVLSDAGRREFGHNTAPGSTPHTTRASRTWQHGALSY